MKTQSQEKELVIPQRSSGVKTLCSHAKGPGSIPGWGTKIHKPHSKDKKKKKKELLFVEP